MKIERLQGHGIPPKRKIVPENGYLFFDLNREKTLYDIPETYSVEFRRANPDVCVGVFDTLYITELRGLVVCLIFLCYKEMP